MAVGLFGPPAVASNADGRLELFAKGSDSSLYHSWQTSPGGSWSNWSSLGGRLGSPPTVATSADGRLELFAVGDSYNLYHSWQTSLGGSWSNWSSLGSPKSFPSQEIYPVPALAHNFDGRLGLFLAEPDGNLYHIWQTSPNGSWSNWGSLGQAPSISLGWTPVLVLSDDGRLELFILGWGGGPSSPATLCQISQTSPNGNWSGWLTHGQLPFTPISDLALARNVDGRLELFILGADNNLYHSWQTSPGGSWSQWLSFGSPASTTLSRNPMLATIPGGSLEIFVSGQGEVSARAGSLYHIWQTSPGGNWSTWDSLAQSSPLPTGDLTFALTTNDDSRLEIFAMTSATTQVVPNPNAYHIWQTSPGGSWSNWDSLGHP